MVEENHTEIGTERELLDKIYASLAMIEGIVDLRSGSKVSSHALSMLKGAETLIRGYHEYRNGNRSIIERVRKVRGSSKEIQPRTERTDEFDDGSIEAAENDVRKND